jgi:tetratricopeptide repeat protein 21B
MVEAHIFAALINSEAGHMKAAENNLKEAFAQDFSIRENPVFMLMRSDVEIKAKDWEAALQTLEVAMKLPQVVDPTSTAAQFTSGKKYSLPFGQDERARIYTNMIKVYAETKEFDKAKKLIARAISEFSGTNQEVKVIFASRR